MQKVRPELGEQLTELFVLSAALYFRSVGRAEPARPAASPDALHHAACRLLSLSEQQDAPDEMGTRQITLGLAQLVEGLLDTAFLAQRCNDADTERELRRLSDAVAAIGTT